MSLTHLANNMQDFIINSQIIKPGENKQIILNSYELHTKSKIDIPVFVFRGKQAGPTLLLCAGMHGEETNGIEIIRKIITRDEIKHLNCGNIIAIPVLNSISFLFGKNYLNFVKLGLKCSSRKVQQNCVISFLFHLDLVFYICVGILM